MSRMTLEQVSVAKVKATLAERLREVERGSVLIITRHGKPVAALVRPDELAQLERLRAASPQDGLAGLAGGWRDSEELVEAVRSGRRTAARRTAALD